MSSYIDTAVDNSQNSGEMNTSGVTRSLTVVPHSRSHSNNSTNVHRSHSNNSTNVHDIESNNSNSNSSLATPVDMVETRNMLYPPQHQASTVNESIGISVITKVRVFLGGQFMIFIIFIFPFIFCDLYFAYTDDSCVHKPIPGIDLNLFIYLTVCGYVSLGLTLFIILSDIFIFYHHYSPDDEEVMSMFYEFALGPVAIVLKILSIFGLGWTIAGAVLFWGTLNPTDCSSPIYKYVFAQLIIKLSFHIYGVKSKSDEKS